MNENFLLPGYGFENVMILPFTPSIEQWNSTYLPFHPGDNLGPETYPYYCPGYAYYYDWPHWPAAYQSINYAFGWVKSWTSAWLSTAEPAPTTHTYNTLSDIAAVFGGGLLSNMAQTTHYFDEYLSMPGYQILYGALQKEGWRTLSPVKDVIITEGEMSDYYNPPKIQWYIEYWVKTINWRMFGFVPRQQTFAPSIMPILSALSILGSLFIAPMASGTVPGAGTNGRTRKT